MHLYNPCIIYTIHTPISLYFYASIHLGIYTSIQSTYIYTSQTSVNFFSFFLHTVLHLYTNTHLYNPYINKSILLHSGTLYSIHLYILESIHLYNLHTSIHLRRRLTFFRFSYTEREKCTQAEWKRKHIVEWSL